VTSEVVINRINKPNGVSSTPNKIQYIYINPLKTKEGEARKSRGIERDTKYCRGKRNILFLALMVPKKCPFFPLVGVRLRGVNVLESEKGKILGSVFC
jgi:hypothetical protein